jgi:hypothetical protein
LEQVHLVVSDRPLDVLWTAEVLLELPAEIREADELLRREHPAVDEPLAHDLAGPVDDVVVRRHVTRDDLLPESEDGLDHHPVAAPVHRVDGEDDA